ncbi:MAG: energy-coupling factor transporter ATPase [Ruminococcaceae bacterium]|nr:energy-coupling factor transporter ATPase [Oscillospiraceae bacterium]
MLKDIILFDDVSFFYNNESSEIKYVLNNLSINIKRGEFVSIIGYNGSGKSTIAKHTNAIVVPSSGDVFVDGINTKDNDKLYDIRRRVGMVFQNPDNQIVATVVEEDVAFALENLGVDPKAIRQKVDEALDIVGMSKHKTDAPHNLSGGQKQRVAIAGVLAMQPDCIVLDEPTAMLDPEGRKTVLSTIKRLNREKGITVVLITHYMEEAAMTERVIVLKDGEVAKDGTPIDVFSDVDGIRSLGLDVPQVTSLCYELKKEGIDIGYAINIDDCVSKISNLFEEKK